MSSLDKEFKDKLKMCDIKSLDKINQAILLGFLLAKKIKDRKIKQVVFDRSGFKYHGRIKAVADSIFNNGIIC